MNERVFRRYDYKLRADWNEHYKKFSERGKRQFVNFLLINPDIDYSTVVLAADYIYKSTNNIPQFFDTKGAKYLTVVMQFLTPCLMTIRKIKEVLNV